MYIEATRTKAGETLWKRLCKQMSAEAAIFEVARRVETRIDKVIKSADYSGGLATVEVSVRVDGGDWVSEGIYLAH